MIVIILVNRIFTIDIFVIAINYLLTHMTMYKISFWYLINLFKCVKLWWIRILIYVLIYLKIHVSGYNDTKQKYQYE